MKLSLYLTEYECNPPKTSPEVEERVTSLFVLVQTRLTLLFAVCCFCAGWKA